MCNTFFMGFGLKMHYGIILVSQGHLRGQNVISKVKNKMAARYFKVKYDFSTIEASSKCNTSFLCDFDWAIRFLYFFMTQGHLQGQNVNFKVK